MYTGDRTPFWSYHAALAGLSALLLLEFVVRMLVSEVYPQRSWRRRFQILFKDFNVALGFGLAASAGLHLAAAGIWFNSAFTIGQDAARIGATFCAGILGTSYTYYIAQRARSIVLNAWYGTFVLWLKLVSPFIYQVPTACLVLQIYVLKANDTLNLYYVFVPSIVALLFFLAVDLAYSAIFALYVRHAHQLFGPKRQQGDTVAQFGLACTCLSLAALGFYIVEVVTDGAAVWALAVSYTLMTSTMAVMLVMKYVMRASTAASSKRSSYAPESISINVL